MTDIILLVSAVGVMIGVYIIARSIDTIAQPTVRWYVRAPSVIAATVAAGCIVLMLFAVVITLRSASALPAITSTAPTADRVSPTRAAEFTEVQMDSAAELVRRIADLERAVEDLPER